ncbi:MAG: hypothetical protein ACRC3H_17405 [Lachnospiraceae bacterium]
MKYKQGVIRLHIIVGLLIFLSTFAEKFIVNDEYYFIWDIVIKLRDGRFVFDNLGIIVSLLMIIPVMFIGIIYLIRSVWFIKHPNSGDLGFIPMLALAGYAMVLIITFQPYLLINIILLLVDYLAARWLEERDAFNAAYREQKKRELEEKEEKKRVRYFPGKYPAEFFAIVKRIFGKKGEIILFAACFFSAASVYIMFAVTGMVTQVNEKEDILSRNGFCFLVFSLLLVLMTMIISYYIKDLKKSIQLFAILGMRSSTIYLIFTIIFGFNVIFSGITGMVFGFGGASIIKMIWQNGLMQRGIVIVLDSLLAGKTVGFVILVYLGTVLLGLGFNQTNLLSMAGSLDINEDLKQQNRSRRYALPCIGAGILLGAIGIRWYLSRSWAESMYIHILSVMAILALLVGSTTLYLNRLEKNEDKYYRRLIAGRPLYYRYWKSIGSLFYLSVLHFLILAVFCIQLTGAFMKQNMADLYPYDIVCTAYDADMGRLTELAGEHGAKKEIYPMFRMTSVYGSDNLNLWVGGISEIQWPQGQHIAISESTYRMMKLAAGKQPEVLKLSGNEMHVVYQQDLSAKAHTIDWDTARINKRLRIGQPLTYYNTHDIDNVFPVWKVKSEERDVLTGAFYQGMGDNLIVFNDTYFEKEYQKIVSYNEKQWGLRENASYGEWRSYSASHPANMTEGPTQLICFTVPEKEYAGLLESMQYLEDKHAYDRMWEDNMRQFYGRQQMMVNTEAELFFKKLVYFFVVLLLMMMGFFHYYVKLESEMKEFKWQNDFLRKLGMRDCERKKALMEQIKPFAILPMVIGMAGGGVFSVLTAKARLYDAGELRMFIHTGFIVYLVYLTIWVCWCTLMRKWVWRRAEWEK